MRRYLATVGVVVALGWTGAAMAASAPTPDINSGFLGYCKMRPTLEATWSCYVDGLYADVEHSKDPAAELPRLDRFVHGTHGYLESACHMMMHVVGRRYATRHHVTLANLRKYLPRSNDPGCSAGFGMGLVMAPATESIMGSLPSSKAGVGSAMNDTICQMGGAFGVAVIGPVSISVGSTPVTAMETKRARGRSPCSRAASLDIMSMAAAPSLATVADAFRRRSVGRRSPRETAPSQRLADLFAVRPWCRPT